MNAVATNQLGGEPSRREMVMVIDRFIQARKKMNHDGQQFPPFEAECHAVVDGRGLLANLMYVNPWDLVEALRDTENLVMIYDEVMLQIGAEQEKAAQGVALFIRQNGLYQDGFESWG